MGFTTEEIATRIFEGCILTLASDPELDTLALARQINNGDGWTIERSADDTTRGNITRFEGVQVSDDQLVAAHTLALSWL
jgi:hypothetical protein